MKVNSVTFICDTSACHERHTESVWSDGHTDAYLSLVEAGWSVKRPMSNTWKHYCPAHAEEKS